MENAGSDRIWWIAETEGVKGPFTQGEVFDGVRLGSVQPSTLVRQGESGEWAAATVSFPAAFPSMGPRETSSTYASSLSTGPSTTASPGRGIGSLNSRVDVGVSVLLTLITIGIWFAFWLYPRLTWYSRESGRPIGNRVTYFWLLVGLSIGSVVLGLVTFVFAFLLTIVALVFGALLTHLLVVDQVTIIDSRTRMPMKIASPSTMVVLYVVAGILTLTLVLIPIAIVVFIVFYMHFFRNHNAVIESLGQ